MYVCMYVCIFMSQIMGFIKKRKCDFKAVFPSSPFSFHLLFLIVVFGIFFVVFFDFGFGGFGVLHAGMYFSLVDTWISRAKSCLPEISTISYSSDATSSGILLFLVFCFDFIFVFVLAYGLRT